MLNYPIYNYPTKAETDPNVLLSSLGSFWNFIFQEKATLKGYTMGLAEEVIQSYLNLIDTVNTYSVKDCPVLRRENWYPLTIRKSDYKKSAFIFQPNDAVFGSQPVSDTFYEGVVFKFGYPKTTDKNVYAVQVPDNFKQFSLIANRVINPSQTFIYGIDVILQNNTIYFNQDIFSDPSIPKVNIVNESGVIQTFTQDGVVVEDQMLVLWVYGAMLDNNDLTDNFGFIYGLNAVSSEGYKAILESLVNISVDGPTVKAFKFCLAAFYGVPVVIEPVEVIQNIILTSYHLVIVTDKNSYKHPTYTKLLPSLSVGSKVQAGDILVDAIQYFDSSILPKWYETIFDSRPSVPFSSHIFLGNYEFQFFFSTTLDLITLSSDDILNFPVTGRANDVQTFQDYINETDNKSVIKDKLGLSLTGLRSIPIVPSDWVFENFFKNNCALVKLNFSSLDLTTTFFEYLEMLRKLLPSHVYIIFDFNLTIPADLYKNLNGNYTIAAYPNQLFNSDGSNLDGSIPNEAPYFYKSLTERMFVIGFMPMRDTQPLSDISNFDQCLANSNTGSGTANCIAGKVFNHIPANATTRTVRELKLIDYSPPFI